MQRVNLFLPKKQRDLLLAIEKHRDRPRRTHHLDTQDETATNDTVSLRHITPASDISVGFQSALNTLAESHIFQWSTFYRDCLEKNLNRFLGEMQHRSMDDECQALIYPLREHSREIFSRGYGYARNNNHSHDDAIQKSTSGLSRFLGLPLDYYSARWSSTSDHRSAVALRLLASATFSAIVQGYASAVFGDVPGGTVLRESPRSWVHLLAFMTPQHAELVFDQMGLDPWNKKLSASVLPLLDALEVFFARRYEDYLPIPVAGQYFPYQQRLDVGLRPPPDAKLQRVIEARVFLDSKTVSVDRLTDAARREIAVVIAPLRPPVRKAVQESSDLQSIVVERRAARTPVADGAFQAVDRAILSLRRDPTRASPLTYNFAREFPLHNPGRATSYHVPRTSVRDLLRTFERRNGVRLWCSVRRSGKTTACFNLESTTGESVIISQTCGASESTGDTRFYDRVAGAIASGQMLSSGFLGDVVSECAPIDLADRRLVLVIDEYETLFGLLESTADHTPHVRYTVVQPILNQLRGFARNNLLVFLGQQPNAYFILMDQNQLAPYVEQDPFPLFEHLSGTTKGEFAELTQQVLRGHIECTPRFLDCLYAETAGHPYLTVNILVEFVDWLIDVRRAYRTLTVRDGDFDEFLYDRLNVDRIKLSSQYEFFRSAAAQAMSLRGYRDNPWLFAAYWTVRILSLAGRENLRVARADFVEATRRIPVPGDGVEPDASEILRTASLANFLAYDERWVSVKVRTLGRIASAVQPEMM